MIKNRKDLAFYLKEDARRNNASWSKPVYWLHLLASSEHACIYRYISCLRHYEYHLNNAGLWHKCLSLFYEFRLRKLGLRYNMYIGPNICGYGLRIMHLCGGGGVLISARKVGNYCGFNAGVLVGTAGDESARPVIGDYVAFGPGAKAFGNLTIGNNVFVAANSVVTKDIPDNCIVGGIPAKFLKEKPARTVIQ